MKSIIKAIILLLTALICISMCSCSLFVFDHARFEGGKLLTDELMSDIRNEIFSDSIPTGITTEEPKTDPAESIPSDGNENDTLSDTLTNGSNDSSESESTSEKDNTENNDVYWTEGGSVWHIFEDCGHLKNSKNIISGTDADAIAAGKKHVCSTCQKNKQ